MSEIKYVNKSADDYVNVPSTFETNFNVSFVAIPILLFTMPTVCSVEFAWVDLRRELLLAPESSPNDKKHHLC